MSCLLAHLGPLALMPCVSAIPACASVPGLMFSRGHTLPPKSNRHGIYYRVAACGAKVIQGFFDWMNIAIIRCIIAGVISSASFSNSAALSDDSGVQQLAQNILPGGLRYPH